jgi:phytoene dehydrogenase-like protein
MKAQKSQVDVVVVGAGHNTLTAAAYLARCGMGVLVLERNARVGGGATSAQLTCPGFLHDRHATAVIHLQGLPLVKNDELQLVGKFGLKFVYPDACFMTVFDDGDTLSCYRDIDRTCAEIERYSRKDAAAYRELFQFIGKFWPVMEMSLSRPPTSLGNFLSLLERVPGGNDLMRALLRSAYDLVVEHFEHPKVQIHLLRLAGDTICPAEEKGGGVNLLFIIASVHSNPGGAVVGGTQALSDAMVRCIEHHGGEVRVNSPVRRVINSAGVARSVEMADGTLVTASKAVVAAIHPHDLGSMVDGLDPDLVRRAAATDLSPYGALLIHCALDDRLRWNVGEKPDECLDINLVDYSSITDFRTIFDSLRYGRLPRSFSAQLAIHSNYDSSRAPAGKHTLYMSHWVPLKLEGDGDWGQAKEHFADWMIERAARYFKNLSDATILGRHVDSPADMAAHSPSMRAGDIVGIGSNIYQFFGMRPTFELSQYRVPGAQGLYLAGPFMHPGGGLTGGGRAVAMRLMEDIGLDYSRTIRS